jgi:hypothetical protein
MPRPVSVDEKAQLRPIHTSLVQGMESLIAQLKLACRKSQRSGQMSQNRNDETNNRAEKQSLTDQRAERSKAKQKHKVLLSPMTKVVKQANANEATGESKAEMQACIGIGGFTTCFVEVRIRHRFVWETADEEAEAPLERVPLLW